MMMVLCGPRELQNRPAPFPGRRSYEVTKPGFNLFDVYFVLLYFCVLDGYLILL